MYSLSAMKSRRNGTEVEFESRRNGSRRNGSRRNGTNHRRNGSRRNGSDSYYLCSENKKADQLHSYCAADLHLGFCIFKKLVFLWRGSFNHYRKNNDMNINVALYATQIVDDEVMKSKICMMQKTTAQFSLCILAVWSVPILYDTTY